MTTKPLEHWINDWTDRERGAFLRGMKAGEQSQDVIDALTATDTVHAENDRLRTERAAHLEIGELMNAENERLTGLLSAASQAALASLEYRRHIEAENEQLREALILIQKITAEASESASLAGSCHRFATDALNRGKAH